jgi:hypothetical protein
MKHADAVGARKRAEVVELRNLLFDDSEGLDLDTVRTVLVFEQNVPLKDAEFTPAGLKPTHVLSIVCISNVHDLLLFFVYWVTGALHV